MKDPTVNEALVSPPDVIGEDVDVIGEMRMADPKLYAAARESFPPIFAKRLGKSKEWYNETINKMTRIMFDMWASQGGRMSMDQLARLAKVKLGLFGESTEVNEAPTAPPDEMPGFFAGAMNSLKRKSDRFGNVIATKPVISDKDRKALEKKLKADTDESDAEVKKLMRMKKTAEIDAMGFDPANQSKEKEVVIILKRVVLGKPEFILKSNKKEVVPERSSLGGVTWAYADSPAKKVVVNAVHSIRLTEELVERIVKREDGKYEVVSKDGERSFGVYGSEEKAKKRLQQIEFFKRTPYAKG